MPEIGDKMHALIGYLDFEMTSSVAQQCRREHVALLAVHLAHTTDMRRKMTLLHELGDNRLVQSCGLPIEEIARAGKRRAQRVRHNGVTEAQTRKERLIPC